MDNTALALIIIPPVFAGLGYIIKFFIDKSYKKIHIINKNKLEEIEFTMLSVILIESNLSKVIQNADLIYSMASLKNRSICI